MVIKCHIQTLGSYTVHTGFTASVLQKYTVNLIHMYTLKLLFSYRPTLYLASFPGTSCACGDEKYRAYFASPLAQVGAWEQGYSLLPQCINHYRHYISSTYHGSPSEVHSSLSRARWAVVCMNEPARMGQYGVELNDAPENCTANVSDLWYTVVYTVW